MIENLEQENIKNRQKRMVVINDLACYGRCALVVSIPIISAMGIECCPIPTVVLSTNGAFEGVVSRDMASFQDEAFQHFHSLDINFDGASSGFHNNINQLQATENFFKGLRNSDKQTLIFVDPIMGDHGKLYSVSTEEVCVGYQRLLSYADVVTPNLTECCRLLELPYPKETLTQEELSLMLQKLHELGPKYIVITGLDYGDHIGNMVSDGKNTELIMTPRIGKERSGTGDVFMSVLAGSMVLGATFREAVKKSVEFLSKTLTVTQGFDISSRNGVCFELCLKDL
ncbi:MAG TPA: pyridoxamine kinase [Lachnoclostridium phytofermentans]|uniref:pyridoxal kinase n=1 Tax=Lachnoclostridium phytofermentans TaxID=66219 RepID=A0A3D2X4T5_9FIRM|nr:pyridoxamine kinase [Lachnoclostridium sp.]HCL02149.1 pyridoxamine kinase [Lachnoclostridium phytofermentans]